MRGVALECLGWTFRTLRPAYILPQHRDTYHVTPENRFWTHAYPHEVKLRLPTSLQERYHILDQGERLVIPPPLNRGEPLGRQEHQGENGLNGRGARDQPPGRQGRRGDGCAGYVLHPAQ